MWFFVGGALAFILILSYVRLKKCFSFWSRYGVASTSPKTVLGDLASALCGQQNVPDAYDAIYRAFPSQKFVGIYDLLSPSLLVRDPQLIGAILVKDFCHFQDRVCEFKRLTRLDYHLLNLCGGQWKAVRAKLVPTFTTNKLKGMVPMMDYCAKIFESYLKEKSSKEDEAFDAKELSSRFAIDVIGSCIFGLHFNTLHEPDSDYRKMGKLLITPNLKTALLQFLRFAAPKILELFNVSELPRPLLPFFLNLLQQNEEFRKTESYRRKDMMQLMLDIREQEETVDVADKNGIPFNDNVILSNMLVFYVAGYETTASTLSYCLYELALYPEVQNRLREEVQTVLEESDGDVTYDALKKMTYMDMVISETLRKYPTAPTIQRVCTMRYKLPGISTMLQPGTRITLAVYSIHHDEAYYPDPDKFDPERFTPQNIAKRPPFTFLPFGAGPRMCIAARFAKIEMKLCLARLLSKYEFSAGPKTEIPVQMQPRTFQLLPKNGLYIQAKQLAERTL